MSADVEGENDIRRRAAWMLVMLAVVAGLLVLLMTTVFKGGGGSSNNGNAANIVPSGSLGSSASSTASTAAGTSGSSAASSGSTSASASSGASSSGPVPTPSCPGGSTCTVQGDVAGATSAINAYRSQNGAQPITAAITPTAEKCASSSGNDCSGSFVWVRVTNLSGAAVVKGVEGFNGSGKELLAGAKTYELGWAYDPSSKSLFCAVIADT